MDNFIDLAEESFAQLGISGNTQKKMKYCTLTQYTVDNQSPNSNRLNGTYFTVNYPQKEFGNMKLSKEISSMICYAIRELIDNCNNPLIVGLGNAFVTSDSLGSQTINFLSENNKNSYMLFKPSVFGLTKIETAKIIKGVAEYTNPDCIIVVDTLCCLNQNKLYSTVQITDAGIIPGGGLGNNRQPLTFENMGVKVISIGIPLISYSADNLNPNSCVTPKEIDIIVNICAKLIVNGIIEGLSK